MDSFRAGPLPRTMIRASPLRVTRDILYRSMLDALRAPEVPAGS